MLNPIINNFNGCKKQQLSYLEGKKAHLGASVVHWAAKVDKELVVGDLAILLGVEKIENLLHLSRSPVECVLWDALCELRDVESLAVVVIHDAE